MWFWTITGNYEASASLGGTVIRQQVNRSVQYGLMALAFFLPFPALHNILEYFLLGLVVLWLVSGSVSGGIHLRRTSLDLPILLFFGWILVTTPLAVDPWYSLAEWRKNITRFLMFFFVVNATKEERQVRNIVLAFVMGGIVQAGAAVSAMFGEGVQILGTNYREDGWTSSSQWLSSYLVMLLPFCYLAWTSERRSSLRWVYASGIMLAILALFFTHTRAAWVAVIIQALVLVALRSLRNASLAGALAVVAIAFVFVITAIPGSLRDLLMHDHYTSTSSMLVRFNTWQIAAGEIASHPLTGLGYGKHSFRHVLPESQEPVHDHIHNTFLAIAAEVGIPGFLLFCWVFLRILRCGLESWKLNPEDYSGQLGLAVVLVTVGMIVRNLFDDMFVGTLVYLFWLLIGLLFVLILQRQSGEGATPP